jgi:rod shape-determining protein MreD
MALGVFTRRARPSAPTRPGPARLWLVPILSTLAASCLTLLPAVAESPALPSCGLLMALGWRLLRPEMWPAWVALPLGLFDDLIGGAPLGTAMSLWALAFLALEIADNQPMWRDYWLHWGMAALCVAGVGLGQWAFARFVAGGGALAPFLPQILLGALLFPVAARLCFALDRWRLGG